MRVALGLVVAVVVGACGARTSLEVGADAGVAAPDARAPLPDAGPPPRACARIDARVCRPVFAEPLALAPGETAQAPDVAWTGERLVVAWDGSPGVEIAGVTLEGAIVSRASARGINVARIEWNPVLGAALVVTDSAVHWVDARGELLGSADARVRDGQLAGDAWPTRTGFELVGGVLAWSGAPELSHATLGASPVPFAWDVLDPRGPYLGPEHAEGEDGLATWGLAAIAFMPAALLLRLDGERIVERREIGALLPATGNALLDSIAERRGALYGLFDAAPDATGGWSQWITELVPGGRPAWRIDQSANGGRGMLLALGGELVVVSADVHPTHAVSLAVFDPDATEPIGELVPLSSSGPYSHSPRAARTPTGAAIVWNEGSPSGLTSYLQVLDCCADE